MLSRVLEDRLEDLKELGGLEGPMTLVEPLEVLRSRF